MSGIVGVVLTDLKVTPGNVNRIIELNRPTAENSGDRFLANVSSVAQSARGFIQDTSIDIANAQVFHICDPKSIVALTLANVNSQIAQTIAKAREDIINFIIADSLLGPIYTAAKDLLDKALSALKIINKTLFKINKLIQEANNIILYAQGFINMIASLPYRVAQALTQCLSLLRNALKQMLAINLGDIGAVIQQTQLAISQTQSAIAGVKTTGQNLNNTANTIASLPSALSTNLNKSGTVLSSSLTSFTSTTSLLVSITANSSNYTTGTTGRNGV
jgi:hypothetical protein